MQEVGTFVSAQSRSDKAVMLYDKVISKSDDFIPITEWLEEKELAPGVCMATLAYSPKTEDIMDSLQTLLEWRNPSILVVPSDTTAFLKTIGPDREKLLSGIKSGFQNYLTSKQFRVKMLESLDEELKKDLELKTRPMDIFMKVAANYKSDYLVTFDANPLEMPKSEVFFYSMVRVNADIVNMSVRREVANNAAQISGQSRTSQLDATDDGVKKAGLECARQLSVSLIKDYQRQLNDGILYNVKFKSLNFQKRRDLRVILNTHPKIQQLRGIRGESDWQEYEFRAKTKDAEELVGDLIEALSSKFKYSEPTGDAVLIESQTGTSLVVNLKDVNPPAAGKPEEKTVEKSAEKPTEKTGE